MVSQHAIGIGSKIQNLKYGLTTVQSNVLYCKCLNDSLQMGQI